MNSLYAWFPIRQCSAESSFGRASQVEIGNGRSRFKDRAAFVWRCLLTTEMTYPSSIYFFVTCIYFLLNIYKSEGYWNVSGFCKIVTRKMAEMIAKVYISAEGLFGKRRYWSIAAYNEKHYSLLWFLHIKEKSKFQIWHQKRRMVVRLSCRLCDSFIYRFCDWILSSTNSICWVNLGV